MGLAASQGRLLMLTARKDDVEGDLMRVANKRLELSRDSENISQEYNDALNATKLTYNNGAQDVDVSFGMLPSVQCMLTDTSGAVVLDDALALDLGVSGNSGGKQDLDNTKAAAFINKVLNTNIYTADNLPAVSSSAPPSSGTPTGPSFTTNYKDSDVFDQIESKGTTYTSKDPALGTSQITTSGTGTPYCFYRTQGIRDDGKNQSLTAGDMSGAIAALDTTVGDVVTDTKDAVLAVLANNFGSQYSSVESELSTAADTAAGKTKDFYDSKATCIVSDVGADDAKYTTTKCAGTNEIWDNPSGAKEFFIDLTQVAKTFLAYFDQACSDLNNPPGSSPGSSYANKVDTKIYDGDKVNSSQIDRNGGIWSAPYVTETARPDTGGTDPTVPSTVAGTGSAPATTGADGSTLSAQAAYYYHLFQAICSGGWVKDSSINNQAYMQGQIQQGNCTVEQYENGAWSVLSTNDPNSKLSVADDDTAAQKAEAKYDAEKDKIDAKEKILDLQQNGLDTERASIMGFIDSTQKILDKHTGGDFKLFQQG